MNLRKSCIVLLALLLAAMVMIPMVSAAHDTIVPGDSRNIATAASNEDSIRGNASARLDLLPYATISAYGPGSAARNQQVSLYTSGEIGNIVNVYWQKFYIQNLNTGTLAGILYVSTPSDWTKTGDMYSKTGYVVLHDTFSSSWSVKFTQAGTYEVVASVVGAGTVPNAQSRFTISVS